MNKVHFLGIVVGFDYSSRINLALLFTSYLLQYRHLYCMRVLSEIPVTSAILPVAKPLGKSEWLQN